MKSHRIGCFTLVSILLLAPFLCFPTPGLCAPPTYNGTGIWQYSTSNPWNDCGEPAYTASGTVIVNQTGNSVSFIVEGTLYSGTVSGATYTVSASYPEGWGTVTEDVTFTLSAGGTSGSGSAQWTYTEPGWSCKGTYNLSVTKLQAAPTFNSTGIWEYHAYGGWSDYCSADADTYGYTALTQNGDTFTYTDELGIHAGRVSGRKYIASITYEECAGCGTTTQTVYIELAGDGQSGTGYEIWTWSDGSFTCSGGRSIYIWKLPTSTDYNATGIWTVTLPTFGLSGTVGLTQDANTFRFAGFEGTQSGLVSGSNYISIVSYPYQHPYYGTVGTATESSYFYLSNSNSGFGSVFWYWTDGWYDDWLFDALTLSRTAIANNPPNAPVLSSPANGASGLSLTPTLQTGSFSDPDRSDTHAQTEWQISDQPDFSTTVLSTASASNFTALTVPLFTLKGSKTYYWRARFYDNNLTGSAWSAARYFTTGAGNDLNGNGIRDDQENLLVDLNKDGQADYYQSFIKSSNTAVGSGQMGASLESDPSILSIDSIESVAPNTISTVARPYSMPLGLFTIKMSVVKPTDKAEVKVYFSQPAPAGAHWYMYDPIKGWVDYTEKGLATFSSDRYSVTLKLKDWGYGDADGTANAKIVDPGCYGLAAWVTGCVNDCRTGEKILDAQVTLKGTLPGSEVVLKTTDGCYLSPVIPDTYSISITAPGYDVQTSSVVVPEAVITETVNMDLRPKPKAMPFLPLLLQD